MRRLMYLLERTSLARRGIIREYEGYGNFSEECGWWFNVSSLLGIEKWIEKRRPDVLRSERMPYALPTNSHANLERRLVL